MTLIDVGYKKFSVPGRTTKRKAVRSNRAGDARRLSRKIFESSAFFYGFMYSDTANVNEARKALWNKTFRASDVIRGSIVLIVSGENSERQSAVY